MTTVFVSHGTPMLAVQPGQTGAAWQALSATLPKPEAILCISAHWESPELQVSSAARPETIHDFGGFPPALYDIEYPVHGAPALAARVAQCLQQAGLSVSVNATRGLDHGAWVPCRILYPDAEIPVTQLSLQRYGGAAQHYDIGQALQPLHAMHVLILASGAVTHNLSDFFSTDVAAPVLPYVPVFSEWLGEAIAQGDVERLLNYRSLAPQALRAHPSEEHLMPLFVALGAGQGRVRRIQPETTYGILAMDSYLWES